MSSYNNKRGKVFIYSRADAHELADKFSFLKEEFEILVPDEREQANFIIYDLDNPDPILRNEIHFSFQHRKIKCQQYSCMPVILVRFNNTTDQYSQEWIKKIKTLYECSPPICEKEQEIINTLNWFDFVFHPVPLELVGSRIIDQTLQHEKQMQVTNT